MGTSGRRSIYPAEPRQTGPIIHMTTPTKQTIEPTLAKSVAAEDLLRGDFVALLSEIYEYPSFLWCCDASLAPDNEPIKLRFRGQDGGRPLRILDVCLPFVFVEQPGGGHRTLDVRYCQLVRLDREYSKRVWKELSRRKRKRKPRGDKRQKSCK